MRHLGLEVHRLEKLMARQRGYSAAHQDADRQTGMHGYLLRYLYENQERDVFQRDIEKAFSISRSSVTVTLQLMEKNGLIRRESVAQDARLKRIVLTQKARDLHRQIEADILAFESNLARGISEEEQEVFLRVAKKMQENLREGLAKQGISICKGGDCE
ncbi:MarR family winged helix-turn-helix transcriptional regulator [Ruminococcus callidus]|jgi:MarR family transcriptional repressor of mepA|uniref:MarR family winged helix-turn-helix transcriptional regulator n=1 Tax=Ruminococcus callidus TaxID=40519 RepID=UPI0023F21EAC|nr:MarR family transcriptional regulator [Ruminococcus callidus]